MNRSFSEPELDCVPQMRVVPFARMAYVPEPVAETPPVRFVAPVVPVQPIAVEREAPPALAPALSLRTQSIPVPAETIPEPTRKAAPAPVPGVVETKKPAPPELPLAEFLPPPAEPAKPVAAVVALPQLKKSSVAAPVPIPPANLVIHTVQAGETLSGIAQKYLGHGGQKSVAKIVAVNTGLNPDRIRVGQKLTIPASN